MAGKGWHQGGLGAAGMVLYLDHGGGEYESTQRGKELCRCVVVTSGAWRDWGAGRTDLSILPGCFLSICHCLEIKETIVAKEKLPQTKNDSKVNGPPCTPQV